MSLLNNMVWCLSNLCRGKPTPELSLVAPAIGPLAELLYKEVSVDVLVDAVWALSYLSDGGNDRIDAVMNTGVATRLIQFLGGEYAPQLLTPTVRCLGNFATGSDKQTQAVIDAGIFDHFGKLLENPKVRIFRQSTALLLFPWLWLSNRCSLNNNRRKESERNLAGLHQILQLEPMIRSLL
jgi:importin subunit alpha-1